jgi:predicted sulfurtransferase
MKQDLEQVRPEFHTMEPAGKSNAAIDEKLAHEGQHSEEVIQDEQSVGSSSLPDDHDHWRIILYYCYIDLDATVLDSHVAFQHILCDETSLRGRIRVSTEGINGVLSGRTKDCHEYEDRLREELIRLSPPIVNTRTEETWELDVKYCHLRTDLSVATQLFDSLICKEAKSVVSLFEPGLTSAGTHEKKSEDKKKKSFSKQTNRRRRRQQQRREMEEEKQLLENHLRKLACQMTSFPGGQHLSPQEWDQKLHQAEQDTAVLLDCRNVYESNVGYFQVPQGTTVLTNTRKYSDLPKILVQSKEQWAHKRTIFMYCTGGVRCEQASKFVQALVADETTRGGQDTKSEDVQVYQLHGGIQRYLEYHHQQQQKSKVILEMSAADEDATTSKEQEPSMPYANPPCLFRGLNFVFDPRRTDPMVDSGTCVGQCCLCQVQHDDYDNGHAPVEEQESRCCKCRILLLVCKECRETVQCWGETRKAGLPKLYCGVTECNDYQATGKSPVSVVGQGRVDDDVLGTKP